MMGDTLSNLLKRIGILECAGCEKRKDYLNELHEKLKKLTKLK